MRTIQSKILEIPGAQLNGKKTSVKMFSKIWVYLARLSSFLEILGNAVFSPLEVAENSNRTFWLNESAQNLYFSTMRFLLQFSVMSAISLDQQGK